MFTHLYFPDRVGFMRDLIAYMVVLGIIVAVAYDGQVCWILAIVVLTIIVIVLTMAPLSSK